MKIKLYDTGYGKLAETNAIFLDNEKKFKLELEFETEFDDMHDIMCNVVDEKKKEYALQALDNVVSLPRALYSTPQTLQISVHSIKDDVLVKSYVVEPIRLSTFRNKIEPLRVVDSDMLATMSDDILALRAENATLTDKVATQAQTIESLVLATQKLQDGFIRQLEHIKTLINQVALIESQYSVAETI